MATWDFLYQRLLDSLRRAGWLAVPIPGGIRLSRTGRPAGRMDCVHVSANAHWVCFQWPLGRIGPDGWHLPDPLRRAVLYRYLLHLNERGFMARFALDTEGQLLLATEIPADMAGDTLAIRALEALAVCADRYLDSIARLTGPEPQLPPMEESRIARRQSREARHIPEEIVICLKGLEHEGWGARERPSGPTWHLGYKGRVRLFEVYLTVTDCWAYFQAPVLVESRPSALQAGGKIQAAFLEYLLRLNDALYMAKFGLDEKGQVLLSLELPVEALDSRLFRLAARTLACYLDRYAREAQIMASLDQDPYLTDLLTRLEAEKSVQPRR